MDTKGRRHIPKALEHEQSNQDIDSKNKQKELEEYKKDLEKKVKVSEKIASEKKQLEAKIEKDVKNFFHEEFFYLFGSF